MRPYCVSLEMAKRLKDAGFPQGSTLWFYLYMTSAKKHLCYSRKHFPAWTRWLDKSIDAPTVGELGETLIPYYCPSAVRHGTKKNQDEEWAICWIEDADYDKAFTAGNEADARAEMWLFLSKENNASQSPGNKPQLQPDK